jgi:hypothetical protein
LCLYRRRNLHTRVKITKKKKKKKEEKKKKRKDDWGHTANTGKTMFPDDRLLEGARFEEELARLRDAIFQTKNKTKKQDAEKEKPHRFSPSQVRFLNRAKVCSSMSFKK